MPREIYITIWRNKWITAHATTIDDFIETFEFLAKQFRQWKEWGITLHSDGGISTVNYVRELIFG